MHQVVRNLALLPCLLFASTASAETLRLVCSYKLTANGSPSGTFQHVISSNETVLSGNPLTDLLGLSAAQAFCFVAGSITGEQDSAFTEARADYCSNSGLAPSFSSSIEFEIFRVVNGQLDPNSSYESYEGTQAGPSGQCSTDPAASQTYTNKCELVFHKVSDPTVTYRHTLSSGQGEVNSSNLLQVMTGLGAAKGFCQIAVAIAEFSAEPGLSAKNAFCDNHAHSGNFTTTGEFTIDITQNGQPAQDQFGLEGSEGTFAGPSGSCGDAISCLIDLDNDNDATSRKEISFIDKAIGGSRRIVSTGVRYLNPALPSDDEIRAAVAGYGAALDVDQDGSISRKTDMKYIKNVFKGRPAATKARWASLRRRNPSLVTYEELDANIKALCAAHDFDPEN